MACIPVSRCRHKKGEEANIKCLESKFLGIVPRIEYILAFFVACKFFYRKFAPYIDCIFRVNLPFLPSPSLYPVHVGGGS